MKTPPKKLRVNKKQTTRLLELSLQKDENATQTNTDAQKGKLLLDTLRSKLPMDRTLQQSLPEMIQSIAEELKSLSGASLKELLTDPDTKTDILIKVKDHAKECGLAAQNEAEREVSLALYYAAIAAALVYHNHKISEHSYKGLKEAFSKLMQNTWIPDSLKTLFRRSRQISR